MLEGPRADTRGEGADIDDSWASRAGAGIVVVVEEEIYGEVMVEGSVGSRRGSSEDPRMG
jgi:hypothetical protein